MTKKKKKKRFIFDKITGNQLGQELLLELSDTLHIRYKYIGHVHKELSCKKLTFYQNGCLSNLTIMHDICIDSAYAGNSTRTTAFAEII